MKKQVLAFLAVCAMTTGSQAFLLLHWTLDEGTGTTAGDSSGNGYDGGYLTGTPGWAGSGGADGGYVNFNAAGHAFRTTSFPTISGAAFTPFTISIWIRSVNTQNNTAAVLRTGVGNQYYSVKTQSGTVRQVARNTAEIQSFGGAVNDGNWHHIAAVYNSETSREIFVDGLLANHETTSVPFLVPSGFSIGALDRSEVSIVDDFEGDIDDVQLYDHALNAAEVTFLFNNAGTAINVPEPSSSLLLGLTLGLGLLCRRRSYLTIHPIHPKQSGISRQFRGS